MKCIDCDYLATCEVSSSEKNYCNRYCHTPKVITRLYEKDGDISKIRRVDEE